MYSRCFHLHTKQVNYPQALRTFCRLAPSVAALKLAASSILEGENFFSSFRQLREVFLQEEVAFSLYQYSPNMRSLQMRVFPRKDNMQ